MTPRTPEERDAVACGEAEVLRQFLRQHHPSGYRMLTFGPNCPCMLCTLDRALTAAEARGREQERARLAALSPGEVSVMVLKALGEAHSFGWAVGADDKRRNQTQRWPCAEWAAPILAAFAAQRERVVGECAEMCDRHAAMWRGEAGRTSVSRYAAEFLTNAAVMDVAANNIRALVASPRGPGEATGTPQEGGK